MSAVGRPMMCDVDTYPPMPPELVALGLPKGRRVHAGCGHEAVAYLVRIGDRDRPWTRVFARCRAHLPNGRSGWEYIWREIERGDIVFVAVEP